MFQRVLWSVLTLGIACSVLLSTSSIGRGQTMEELAKPKEGAACVPHQLPRTRTATISLAMRITRESLLEPPKWCLMHKAPEW